MIDGTKGTNNNSFMDVLLTLKQNIMRDLNVAEVCKIVEVREGSTCVVNPINDNSKRLFVYNLYNSTVSVDDLVLVVFTNTDSRLNLKKAANDISFQNTNSKLLHDINYGIIVGKSSGSGGDVKLYDTTGQNTDGAMTQKASTDNFALKSDVHDATLSLSRNGTLLGTFSANANTNKSFDITVPTQASDVNALPDSTKYAASISLTISSNTITVQLKDQDGNDIGSSQSVSVSVPNSFVNASYDNSTKKITFTYADNTSLPVDISSIISGLQTEITSSNKLPSDLVDDTNQTNKFATSSQLTQIGTNQTDISNIKALIPSQATPTNQMADKDFVNSSINALAAFYITRTAAGDNFRTNAELMAATTFYSGGSSRIPTQNDYTYVQYDETKGTQVSDYSSFTTTQQYVGYYVLYNNEGVEVTTSNKDSVGITPGTTIAYENLPTTRYSYQGGTYPNGQWDFQLIVNNSSLTAAQIAAINSGITAALTAQITTNQTNIAGLVAAAVTNVLFDSTNKKIQMTINGVTTDVVTFGDNAFNSTPIPTSPTDLGISLGTTSGSETINVGNNYLDVMTRNTPQYISAVKTFNANIIVVAGNKILDGVNSFGLLFPSMTGWTADKTIATTDQIPVVPTVNDSTIIITQGGVEKGRFTLNQASGQTIALDAGGGGSSIDVQVNSVSIVANNVANFITKSAYNATTNPLATVLDLPLPDGFAAFAIMPPDTGTLVQRPTSIGKSWCSKQNLAVGDHILVFRNRIGDSYHYIQLLDFTISSTIGANYTGTSQDAANAVSSSSRVYAGLGLTNTFTGVNTFSYMLTLSDGLSDGNNANYKILLPDTTSWTGDKTLAITDQIPNIPSETTAGKVLKSTSTAGTFTWGDDNDTHYTTITSATNILSLGNDVYKGDVANFIIGNTNKTLEDIEAEYQGGAYYGQVSGNAYLIKNSNYEYFGFMCNDDDGEYKWYFTLYYDTSNDSYTFKEIALENFPKNILPTIANLKLYGYRLPSSKIIGYALELNDYLPINVSSWTTTSQYVHHYIRYDNEMVLIGADDKDEWGITPGTTRAYDKKDEWVLLSETESPKVTSTSASATMTINLANIVPGFVVNNNYQYEVMVINECYNSDTRYIYTNSDLMGNSSSSTRLADMRYSSNGRQGGWIRTMVCKQKINFVKSGTINNFDYRVIGYRRYK